MTKTAIIFDLDGVIIDSFSVMKDSFVYAYKQHFPDKNPPFREYIQHLGKGFNTIMKELNLPSSLYEPFKERSIFLSDRIKLFEEIIPLLDFLNEKKAYIGISTGKDRDRTYKLLKKNNIIHYFDKIVCIDDVNLGKPNPESLNKHLIDGKLRKNKFFFIGDSVSDILCAHNAEVKSIAALWGIGEEDQLRKSNPSFAAKSPFELKEILTKFL